LAQEDAQVLSSIVVLLRAPSHALEGMVVGCSCAVGL